MAIGGKIKADCKTDGLSELWRDPDAWGHNLIT